MIVVGLTGGIATGKSTVGRLLSGRHGVPVIDADQVARAVVEPGTPVLEQLVEAFGDDVLQADGSLDRSAMRTRIMNDATARATLDGIMHPAIRAAMGQQIMAFAGDGAAAVVVEAALLVETGGYRMYPALIVVSCDPETQVSRVMARDSCSESDARKMLATQLPLADKEAVATHIIRNDDSLEALSARTDEVWGEISSSAD